MNTAYITHEALTQLYKKYPSAYYFLQHENLKEEYTALQRELTVSTSPQRIHWINDRLAELAVFEF